MKSVKIYNVQAGFICCSNFICNLHCMEYVGLGNGGKWWGWWFPFKKDGDACQKNENLTLKGDEFEWLRRGELLEKRDKRIYNKVLQSEGLLLYHMLPKANEISDHVLHGSAPQPRLIRMQWSMSTFTARLIFSHVRL